LQTKKTKKMPSKARKKRAFKRKYLQQQFSRKRISSETKKRKSEQPNEHETRTINKKKYKKRT